MVALESNVVAFDTLQSKQKEVQRRGDQTRMIAECRTILTDRTHELMQVFFAKVDDELFKMSDKAENSGIQSLYFEAMRYVRRERDSLNSRYIEELTRQYDDFWHNKPTKVLTLNDGAKGGGEDDFVLVEDEILEENLAITSMIEKGNTLYHRELFGLGKRFGSFLNRDEVPIELNPVAPSALCQGFECVMKPQLLDLKVKLFIYKLYENQVLNAFGPVYHEMNSYLANEGILPSIAKAFKRQGGMVSATTRSELDQAAQKIGRALEESEPGETAVYLEAFQAMQSLLDGWRNQLGLPSQSAALLPGEMTFDPGEVLNALSHLQQPSQIPNVGGSGISAEGLKVYVANQLGKIQPDEAVRPLGRLEEDIIDMVAMIFDFILEDRNLPAPVKALIARLQIPIVKVAILEKSFFAKKSHPARVLLNSLSQAGIALETSDSENPVFRKIEQVVGRVLEGFDQNVGLFAELLEDFTAFIEKESQRSSMLEERTRQSTQSKEQLRLAKRMVAYEITSRLRHREVASAAKSFLLNAWNDVLVLAYLRRDKSSDDWDHGLAVMDRLLWSVTPPTDEKGRRDLIGAIPGLVKALTEGLESISYDSLQSRTLMRDLEDVHHSVLRSALQPDSPIPQVDPNKSLDVAIRDPELAEAIREIKANLPDIDDVGVDEVGAVPMNSEEIVLGSLRDYSSGDDEFNLKAKSLTIGEWVEFVDEATSTNSRAKLSWKSQVTSQYVFVNRKGMKVAEMSLGELARRFRVGSARVVEGATVPLMDRALSALMQSLKNPVKKPETQA